MPGKKIIYYLGNAWRFTDLGGGGGKKGDWPYQRVIALAYTGGEANLWDETFSLNISSYSIFYSPAVGRGAYLGML